MLSVNALIYLMIHSFGDKATSDLYHGISSNKLRKIPNSIRSSAIIKLDMLNAASTLRDLLSPPGNRLESLSGNLSGFYSIRINDQWRIIFIWKENGPEEVSIVDYHK